MSRQSKAGSVSLLLSTALVVVVLGSVSITAADEGPAETEKEAAPRHRISFGAQWFDAAEGDSVIGSLTCSWVPSNTTALRPQCPGGVVCGVIGGTERWGRE